MGFQIGQKVAVIDDQEVVNLKSGEIRVIKKHKKCCTDLYDIGAIWPSQYGQMICPMCDELVSLRGGITWVPYYMIAPLDDWLQAEEAKESLLKDIEIEVLNEHKV